MEAAIASLDPDLDATVGVQAAVIGELRAANATLAGGNAEQARLIVTLQAQLAELERRLGQDASNSSKPPSSDGLRKPARAQRRTDERAARGAGPASSPAPRARTWPRSPSPTRSSSTSRPVRRVRWGLGRRAGARVQARQVVDLPRLRLGVVEHRAERRRCACGTATAAAFPDHVRAAACYGPGVRALVCSVCVHQHLPVDRAGQLLADVLGASVATGTLAAVMAGGAAGLDGFVEVVRAGLAAAPVAHFDETGARVAGRLHWVHSASTAGLSLFSVHARRGEQAMDAAGVLPGFAGVAVHDGWAPYWR